MRDAEPWLQKYNANVFSLPSATRGRRILMLTVSQIEIDVRVNKVARSLASQGYTVRILCFQTHPSQKSVEEAYLGVYYRRVPCRGIPAETLYQEAFVTQGLAEEYDFVHVNDLTSLIAGWVLANAKRVPLIYDAHEMWTENVDWDADKKEYVAYSSEKRLLITKLERFLVRRVNLFVSVSRRICEEFERRYRLPQPVMLLPNFPELSLLDVPCLPTIREQAGLPQDAFVILYIGGVGPARNFEVVIQSLQYLPTRCVFVIQGPYATDYEQLYRSQAERCGVDDRLFFLPPVGRDEVVAAASSADCGVVMLRNLCLNFYWFYPNKFFEYMLAGIPVVASAFPEINDHLDREQCGLSFDPDDPQSAAQAFRSLFDDREKAKSMGIRGRKGIIREYNWDIAVRQLFEAYEQLNTPRVENSRSKLASQGSAEK